ncbi:SLATT domain-containing protein [Actinokineospora sp. 24-640]
MPLPGLFDSADNASIAGQRRYVNAVRLRLTLAVVAAATGVVAWKVGTRGIDLAAMARPSP